VPFPPEVALQCHPKILCQGHYVQGLVMEGVVFSVAGSAFPAPGFIVGCSCLAGRASPILFPMLPVYGYYPLAKLQGHACKIERKKNKKKNTRMQFQTSVII